MFQVDFSKSTPKPPPPLGAMPGDWDLMDEAQRTAWVRISQGKKPLPTDAPLTGKAAPAPTKPSEPKAFISAYHYQALILRKKRRKNQHRAAKRKKAAQKPGKTIETVAPTAD